MLRYNHPFGALRATLPAIGVELTAVGSNMHACRGNLRRCLYHLQTTRLTLGPDWTDKICMRVFLGQKILSDPVLQKLINLKL